MTDELLTQEEVAAILKVTPRLVRKLWAERQLGGVKIGKLVRHRRSDVERYIKSRTIGPR